MNPADWKNIKQILSATLDLPEAERRDFLARETNISIRKEVEKLLAAQEKAESFMAKSFADEYGLGEKGFEENLIGKQIDDYKILEKIGEGGMGTVFLAEQMGEDFTQKVALKLIKRGMDTNAVLKRFLLERQILSQLEHPNIARLLDGGSTKDGLPYFVMEYVSGETIKQFCENQQFDTNERLELFTKICAAISYAHQKLIVHRDIKPSNIIVTNDGTPKLLDFGIAKILSPDWNAETTEATATNFRLMTPEYASPEQLRGKMTTTSTDVYSLGVVLYELLTGTRPFRFENKSVGEIIETVTQSEPVPPSVNTNYKLQITTKDRKPKTENQINRKSLRGDLDNIILKAIRKQARERYRSVEEFCEDINRYLNGLPVRATADSSFYRFKKFVGRNRIGTAIAAVILFLSVFSVWQAVIATRERQRANEQFNQVRKLANSVLFDYQDGIKSLPGSTAIREKMVNDGAEYLDKLAAENPSDPNLLIELAKAYDRLGDVKGNFFTPSLGNSTAAKEFYSKALSIKEKLHSNYPNDLNYAEEIAVTFDKFGDLEFGNGNQTPAVEYYQKAVNLRENILQKNAENQNLRYRLAKGFRNIGVRGRNKENTNESLALCQKAIEMIEVLLKESPENVEFQEAQADFYEGIPIILETNPTRRAEAVEGYRNVIEMRRRQSEKYPNNSVVRQKFGMSYSYLGDTFYELGNLPESVVHYKKSLEILDPLAIQDKQNEQLKQDQSAVRGSLAFSLAELGETVESLEAFQIVLRNFETKLANDPTDKTTHFRIAMAKEGLGKTYENFGKSPKTNKNEKITAFQNALINFEESLEIYKIYQDKSKIFPSINVDVDKAIKEATESIKNCRNQLKTLTGKN